MALREDFKGCLRVWVSRGAGAVIGVAQTSDVVCFVGYTGEGKPDTETADYIAELHNQAAHGDDPRQGWLPV